MMVILSEQYFEFIDIIVTSEHGLWHLTDDETSLVRADGQVVVDWAEHACTYGMLFHEVGHGQDCFRAHLFRVD